MSVAPAYSPLLGKQSGNVARRKLQNVIMLTLCMLAAGLAILVLGLVLFFCYPKALARCT